MLRRLSSELSGRRNVEDFEGVESIARRMRIILPTSTFRARWDWWIIVLVVYNAVSIPLEIGFETVTHPAQFAVDVVVDLFFISDIIINFRTAYHKDDGELQLDTRAIALSYARSWFVLDLVASVPIDWFLPNSAGIGVAKIPRLLRLARLMKKFDKLASARALRVVNLLMLFLLFAHWIACLWWLIGFHAGPLGWPYAPHVATILLGDASDAALAERTGADVAYAAEAAVANQTLLEQLYREHDLVPLGKKYLTAVYWALTMVMKSPWLAPARTSEQIYASVIVVMGAMAFAVFIGLVTAMIASYDKSNAQYRDQVTTLHQYGRAKLLPAAMRQSLIQYHDEYWTNAHGGLPERALLRSMPAHVRPRVLLEVYRPLIEKCAWLQECSLMGCAEFLLKLQPEVCRKGDSIVLAGTVPNHFYILYQGELQITYPPSPGLEKVKKLLGASFDGASAGTPARRQSTRVPQGRVDRAGTLIGFAPPFAPAEPLRYSVRACSRATFYSISRDDFREVLTARPTDAPLFMKAVVHANKIHEAQGNKGSRGSIKNGDDHLKVAETSFAEGAEAASPASNKRRSSSTAAQTEEDERAAAEHAAAVRDAQAGGWLPASASAAPIAAAPTPAAAAAVATASESSSSSIDWEARERAIRVEVSAQRQEIGALRAELSATRALLGAVAEKLGVDAAAAAAPAAAAPALEIDGVVVAHDAANGGRCRQQ